MRRQRPASKVLVALALLIWGCFYLLTNRYDATRPTVENELSGRVYPLNSHGHVVYLTRTEEYSIRFLVFAAVSCFIAGLVLDRRSRRLHEQPDHGKVSNS